MRHLAFCAAALVSFTAIASADVISDVRSDVAAGRWEDARRIVDAARTQTPLSPAAVEAMSWLARGELAGARLDAALQDARATRAAALKTLGTRALDGEPHLAIALGAAIEVEAQVLASRGEHAAAIALLQRDRARFAGTSIATRIQKNLNLLTLVGKPAPPLEREPHLGATPPTLASLVGKPVLLFFWADWCGDCKATAPVIARLATELAPRGLTVIAPTQTYGAVAGEEVGPDVELRFIDEVRRRFYAGLGEAPVPVNAANFSRYGASSVPTIVLIDRTGKVALYHPGRMTYDDLAPRAVALCK